MTTWLLAIKNFTYSGFFFNADWMTFNCMALVCQKSYVGMKYWTRNGIKNKQCWNFIAFTIYASFYSSRWSSEMLILYFNLWILLLQGRFRQSLLKIVGDSLDISHWLENWWCCLQPAKTDLLIWSHFLYRPLLHISNWVQLISMFVYLFFVPFTISFFIQYHMVLLWYVATNKDQLVDWQKVCNEFLIWRNPSW